MTDYDKGHAAGVKDTAAEVVELLDNLIRLSEGPLTSLMILRDIHMQTARSTWLEHAGLPPDEPPLPTRSLLQRAMSRMADVLGRADDGLGHLTCAEAESIAGVLRAYGLPDAADRVILQHGAFGDDDPEDDHHDLYLRMQRGEL